MGNMNDLAIGLEVLYGVIAAFSGLVFGLWQLFSKYSQLSHKIELLEMEARSDAKRFQEILDKIDSLTGDVNAKFITLTGDVQKMRIEMVEAHSTISDRMTKVEVSK